MTRDDFMNALGLLFPGMASVLSVLGLAIVAAVILTPAERLAPANRQPLVWRKGLWLDVIYWFTTPLLTRCITGAVLAGIFLLAAMVVGFERIPKDLLERGFGPISRQPAWLQCIEALILADFIDYWTHRLFHKGPLWRVHAIHHSPEEMNWISSSRVHPLNDLVTRSFQVLPILLLGFSASAILTVVPLIAFYVMFLHSNVRWDFGPLRWVLVSPAYHRWHHTSEDEGIDKNFAGIFPVWDLIFGTAYFPRRLPTRYGLKGYRIPESIWAHLAFPFVHSIATPTDDGAGEEARPLATDVQERVLLCGPVRARGSANNLVGISAQRGRASCDASACAPICTPICTPVCAPVCEAVADDKAPIRIL